MARSSALRLMTDIEKERPTDRAHAVPDAPDDVAPLVFPPSGIVPNITPQPDPNNYSHVVLGQLLSRVRGLEADKAATTTTGLAVLLDEQTATLNRRLDETDRRSDINYTLVSEQVRALAHALDAFGIRLGHVEIKTETGAEKLDRFELDMAVIQTNVVTLQQVVASMGAEITAMRLAATR